MSSSSDRIEIVSSIQRRPRHSVDDKWRILHEFVEPAMTVPYVARGRGTSPSLLFQWRRRMNEGGEESVLVDDDVVSSGKVRDLEKRIRELERVLGKKTLENEILREAVKIAHEKKLISRWPSLPDEGSL